MDTTYFIQECRVCGIQFHIEHSQLAEHARWRTGFFCPCGHGMIFNDQGARKAIEWLTQQGYYSKPMSDQEMRDRKLKAEAERERRLMSKIQEIDDFLARRGKYANGH